MEFKNQYLKYNEFQSLGGHIPEMPFNLLEYEARRLIDSRTQGRLIGKEEVPQEVKMCMYKLIECISAYEENNNINGNISSKSIDGVSVTYVDNTQIEQVIKGKKNKIEDIIYNYLLNVVVDNEHILYLGVC